MVQAVGSSPGPVPPAPAGSGLRAQLAKAESQLADCINCDSARTASGQVKIQAAALRVQSLKARIEEVRNAARTDPPLPNEARRPAEPAAKNSLGTGLDVNA